MVLVLKPTFNVKECYESASTLTAAICWYMQ